jgi:parallel beta-helix repeat protein
MFNNLARAGPPLMLLMCTALTSASGSAQEPTLPARSFGPEPAIRCPRGAVDIRAGRSIQDVVNAHPGTTTFCLKAGVHHVSSSITPKTGNVFIGEYGAILDGSGWTTSDDTQGAFRAHNQDINDVTIRNLVIRKMPQRGIHAYPSAVQGDPRGADHWTIEYNDIAENVVGVVVPNGSVVRNNSIHHNIGNPTSSVYVLQGGGYQLYMATNVVFEHNEISYNSINQKIVKSINVTFRNNFVHHNLANGIWYDGDNVGSLIDGNVVEDNHGHGIFYEVSGQATIRNNVVRRSGDNGIFISTSKDTAIYNNVLESNFGGIHYFLNCAAAGKTNDLVNDHSYDNRVTVGAQSGAFANGVGYVGTCTSTQVAPYLSGPKNLTFSRNTYHLPSLTGRYWLWGETKDWHQWQSLGHDVDGVIAP